jgi:hypothetical protein
VGAADARQCAAVPECVSKKSVFVLRQAQHERRILNDFNLCPIALSLSKGEHGDFNTLWVHPWPRLSHRSCEIGLHNFV